jgi:hypothetical protein
MFGFEPQEAKKLGSEGRFYARIDKFKEAKKPLPRTQHLFWWVFHNCVTHFLLGVCPVKYSFQLHDWSSRKLNAK